MLALTRKAGQKIVIGDNVVITVVEIKGDSVRLAIDAPKEVKILRGEIIEAVARENKQAAAVVDVSGLEILKQFQRKE